MDAAINYKKVDDLSAELARVMRHYIKYLLDREVRSAAWLDSLKQQAGKGHLSLL